MKKSLYISAFIALFAMACSDETLNKIDTNPNIIADAPLNTYLPAAQTLVVQRVIGSLVILSGHAVETTNFTGINTATRFQVGDAANLAVGGGDNWSGGFQALRYFKNIRTKAEQQQRVGYGAIADIMSAYTLSLLVDVYGDIPYTEVGKEDVIQPKFDKAQELYIEMQKLLDTGIQKCDQATTAASRPANDDMIFKGNMTLWKKTAYALKARLYNRLSNTNGQETAQQALAALTNSFGSNENFTFTDFQDTPQNGNQIAQVGITQGTIAIAEGIITALKSYLEPNEDILADPRATIWFTRIGGKVVTTPTSRATTDVTLNGTTYSKPLFYQRRTSPLPMLTYTELKFIEAEAQLRLGDRTKAYTAYEAAVRAALTQASIFNSAVALTATPINAYVARPKVLMGADKLTLKDIITQKYIYLTVFQTQEAYNDVRRTGLITLMDPDGTAKRFPYPVNEISRNSNAPQASDINTVYQDNARLFWAKL
jgi:hypothetical protein